ncbi:hypothetical protein B0H14DRAFT_3525631 [Mycena olivaceomarginata]|nr:hypothetical protein B0H14DRAFT_3525631 [Mycena olivaceomarginata]
MSTTRKVGKCFHSDIVRRCPESFRIQILVIHRRKKSRSRRAQSKDDGPVALSRAMPIRIGAVLRGGRDLSRFESVKLKVRAGNEPGRHGVDADVAGSNGTGRAYAYGDQHHLNSGIFQQKRPRLVHPLEHLI